MVTRSRSRNGTFNWTLRACRIVSSLRYVQTDEELADRQLQFLLLIQGVFELVAADRAALDQDLAKLAPPVGGLADQIQLTLDQPLPAHEVLIGRCVFAVSNGPFEQFDELGLGDQSLVAEI